MEIYNYCQLELNSDNQVNIEICKTITQLGFKIIGLTPLVIERNSTTQQDIFKLALVLKPCAEPQFKYCKLEISEEFTVDKELCQMVLQFQFKIIGLEPLLVIEQDFISQQTLITLSKTLETFRKAERSNNEDVTFRKAERSNNEDVTGDAKENCLGSGPHCKNQGVASNVPADEHITPENCIRSTSEVLHDTPEDLNKFQCSFNEKEAAIDVETTSVHLVPSLDLMNRDTTFERLNIENSFSAEETDVEMEKIWIMKEKTTLLKGIVENKIGISVSKDSSKLFKNKDAANSNITHFSEDTANSTTALDNENTTDGNKAFDNKNFATNQSSEPRIEYIVEELGQEPKLPTIFVNLEVPVMSEAEKYEPETKCQAVSSTMMGNEDTALFIEDTADSNTALEDSNIALDNKDTADSNMALSNDDTRDSNTDLDTMSTTDSNIGLKDIAGRTISLDREATAGSNIALDNEDTVDSNIALDNEDTADNNVTLINEDTACSNMAIGNEDTTDSNTVHNNGDLATNWPSKPRIENAFEELGQDSELLTNSVDFEITGNEKYEHEDYNISSGDRSDICGNLNMASADTCNTRPEGFRQYQSRYKKLNVFIHWANITELLVDVIVSAGNKNLNFGGGVSKAIAMAAGKKLERECATFIKRGHTVGVTEIFVSSAGNLNTKYVLHAVGPKWDAYKDKGKCLTDLRRTVLRCLIEARRLGMSSIALPCISAAIFRVPEELCAMTYMEAVKHFDEYVRGKSNSLEEIHFVDVDNTMVSYIINCFNAEWDKPCICDETMKFDDFQFADNHSASYEKHMSFKRRVCTSKEPFTCVTSCGTEKPQCEDGNVPPLVDVPEATVAQSKKSCKVESEVYEIGRIQLVISSKPALTFDVDVIFTIGQVFNKLSDMAGFSIETHGKPLENVFQSKDKYQFISLRKSDLKSSCLVCMLYPEPKDHETLSSAVQQFDSCMEICCKTTAQRAIKSLIITSNILYEGAGSKINKIIGNLTQLVHEYLVMISRDDLCILEKVVMTASEDILPLIKRVLDSFQAQVADGIRSTARGGITSDSGHEQNEASLLQPSNPGSENATKDYSQNEMNLPQSDNFGSENDIINHVQNEVSLSKPSGSENATKDQACNKMGFPQPGNSGSKNDTKDHARYEVSLSKPSKSGNENAIKDHAQNEMSLPQPTNSSSENNTKVDAESEESLIQPNHSGSENGSKKHAQNEASLAQACAAGSENHTKDKTTDSGTGVGFGRSPSLIRGSGGYSDSDDEAVGSSVDKLCDICMELYPPGPLPCCRNLLCTSCKFKMDRCPFCRKPFTIIRGNQPKGTMNVKLLKSQTAAGYENAGVYKIHYDLHSGLQKTCHPNPGHSFSGTTRTAYIPATEEGFEVLSLLRLAFIRQLIFTIGTSVTTGQTNVVTWNDIHHKTSLGGSYGYPDSYYLRNVTRELADKGVTLDSMTDTEKQAIDIFIDDLRYKDLFLDHPK